MTEFQVLAIPICFILAIGITKILDGAGTAIRQREQVRLHWLPFAWAFVILLFQLQFFSVLWHLHLENKEWTWASYSLILIHPLMYFLATSLLWPTRQPIITDNLLTDFDQNGRGAVAIIGISLFSAIVLNVYAYGSTWKEALDANILNILTGVSAAVVVFSNRRWLQAVATLVFLAIQIYGILVVWARPGLVFSGD